MRLPRNSEIRFETSLCPLPLINLGTLDSDWYEGISKKLK
jgi:NAD+ kinase